MQIETITHKGKQVAIVPIKELKKLVADAEMLADIRAYDAAKRRLDDGDDELIPFEMVERRLKGEPPVKLWREFREITQQKLAKKSGVSREMIAAIETGSKKGAVATLKKLASALGVNLDQLV